MIRGIYHSAAGMLPRYHKLTNISNNLANASTTSYKADRRFFSFALNNELTQPGVNGQGAQTERLNEGLYTEWEQGALVPTRNKTDFAINGPGFFVVQNEDGKEFLTRDGRFKLNQENELVTQAGHKVLDESYAPIIIPDAELFVDQVGTVFVDGQQTTSIMIAEVDSHDSIKKMGGNLYEMDQNMALKTAEETTVHQEHLEESNVNVVKEMVEMIALSRNYDTSQRSLMSQDNTLGRLIDRVPRF